MRSLISLWINKNQYGKKKSKVSSRLDATMLVHILLLAVRRLVKELCGGRAASVRPGGRLGGYGRDIDSQVKKQGLWSQLMMLMT